MTLYQFHDDSGAAIDPHFEVQVGELILLSRGEARRSPYARNTAYNRDLLWLILDRVRRSNLTLVGAWVDSSHVQNLPLEQRRIFFPEDEEVLPKDLSKTLSERMARVGQAPNATGGNRTKRLRFAFEGNPSDEWIARAVGWGR